MTRIANERRNEHPRRTVTELIDRQLPCDLQAEIGVLGSVVLLPSIFGEVASIVQPDDFHDPAHGVIFKHMLALRSANKPLDGTLLVDSLKAAGDLDAIGGVAYLGTVVNAVPNAAHARYYAEIVAEHALRRRVILECTNLLRDAYDAASGGSDLLRDADQAIARIGRRLPSRAKLVKLGDAADAVIRVLENPETASGVNRAMFGLPSVDDALGPIMPGELCIVAARPSMGKTAFAQQVLVYSAIRERPALMVSLEMTDGELATRELCKYTGIDSRAVRRGDVAPEDVARMRGVQRDIAALPFWSWSPAKATLSSIRNVATTAVAKHGVRLIAIDYFQLIATEGKTSWDRREGFVEICHGLKALAKELALPLIVLSQLNRQAEGQRPTMAMLRETGAIEEDADLILFLHHDDPNIHDQRTLIAAKCRGMGKGDLTLKWSGRRTEFSDLGPEDHANYDPTLAQFNRGGSF